MSQSCDKNSRRNKQVALDFSSPFSTLERQGSGIATSRLNYAGTRAARIKLNLNLEARREERLAERTRIAQELHDTLLQGFFAASMQLHAAVDQLPADHAAVKPRFSGVLQLLDRVLERGRFAVQGLRSPNEPVASLADALAGVPDDLGFPST